MLPADPFCRVRAPVGFDRRDRVRLLRDAARQLLDSGTPEGLFLGGAVLAWLQEGRRLGDLEKRFLRVSGEAGSHCTPQALAQMLDAAAPREDSGP